MPKAITENNLPNTLHKLHGTTSPQRELPGRISESVVMVKHRTNPYLQDTHTLNSHNRLIAEEITRELKTKIIGSNVIILEQATSTMDTAKKFAHTSFKNGTVIFAEEQTKGRGRSGHSWSCPKYKGLLFTLLLKHNMQPDHLCLLTGTMAVSITETIRETLQLAAEIKWPNDILIGGKKVGGVLVEFEKGIKKQSTFLIGIGINVNFTEDDFPGQTRLPVTSLAIENKAPINRISLAKALLQDIDKWYSILKNEHYRYITDRWREFCITIGEKLTITDCGKEYTGKVIDISNNGGLMMKLENGEIKILRGEHATIKY
ncbi:MAG TPA: biotin--[acetyl-CoA-carboxylase] ligase [Candidatus Wunengus sp. YC60]|uniref:biotin--[acetyl-CoA-carboxylase] ligase n=1 Tax=Candidatus Wunengus sp. YC60 TaxID=3367697 RepID=UPI0040298F6F